MNEDVKTELVTVSARKIPKRYFETEWEIPEDLDVKTIHLCDYSPSFSHRNDMIVNPVAGWDVPTRYSFELYDLESALKWFISEIQRVKNYSISKLKLRIKLEFNLGEIWLTLTDGMSGDELASFARTAEAVTTRLSNAFPSGVAEYDELYDLLVLVHGETRISGSYIGSNLEPRIIYRKFLTGEKTEIDSLLTIFMNGQTKERIGELSDAELSLLLQFRGKKMLPLTIRGLRYIGEGQPRLVLDGYVVAFDGDVATKEANLAEIIFGKLRDLTQTITYEEIFETLNGANDMVNSKVAQLESEDRAKLSESEQRERIENYERVKLASTRWTDLSKPEQRKYIDDYKQRMRQLNYRLGAMFGLGEIKALVSVDAGIAINHRLL